jgi:hypothetical protein
MEAEAEEVAEAASGEVVVVEVDVSAEEGIRTSLSSPWEKMTMCSQQMAAQRLVVR